MIFQQEGKRLIMVTSMGVAIEKGKVSFAVICGQSMNDCFLKSCRTFNFNPDDIHLMTQFNNFFNEVITKFVPDVIGYKLASHMNLKNDQIHYLYEPNGILRLLCEQKGIKIRQVSAAYIQNKKSQRISKFKEKFEGNFNKGILEAGVIAWEGIG
jgi:hypothetical protein